MNFTIAGFYITCRCVGRSIWRDANDRRYYLLLGLDGRVYECSGDLLREAQGD